MLLCDINKIDIFMNQIRFNVHLKKIFIQVHKIDIAKNDDDDDSNDFDIINDKSIDLFSIVC